METILKHRLLAYDCANGSIPLAKQYVDFLNQSQNEEELELRIRCIEMRKGCAIDKLEELLRFFDGSYNV